MTSHITKFSHTQLSTQGQQSVHKRPRNHAFSTSARKHTHAVATRVNTDGRTNTYLLSV